MFTRCAHLSLHVKRFSGTAPSLEMGSLAGVMPLFAVVCLKRRVLLPALAGLGTLLGCLFACGTAWAAPDLSSPSCKTGPGASRPADVYVPMDSWVYPAMQRLQGLGYADSAYLGLRPWTRRAMQRMRPDHRVDDGRAEFLHVVRPDVLVMIVQRVDRA